MKKTITVNGESIEVENGGKYEFCLDRWEHAERAVWYAVDGKTRRVRWYNLAGELEAEADAPRAYVFYSGRWFEVIKPGYYTHPISKYMEGRNRYIEVVEQHEEYNNQATYEQALRALVKTRNAVTVDGCASGTHEMLLLLSLMFGFSTNKIWCDLLRLEDGEE